MFVIGFHKNKDAVPELRPPDGTQSVPVIHDWRVELRETIFVAQKRALCFSEAAAASSASGSTTLEECIIGRSKSYLRYCPTTQWAEAFKKRI